MECKNQTLFVESNLTWEERIARGHYEGGYSRYLAMEGFTSANIEDQFGEWEWKLFDFSKSVVVVRDAIPLINKTKFYSAPLAQILAFGEKYPHIQTRVNIYGLGTVAPVGLAYAVPVLGTISPGDRGLLMGALGDKCSGKFGPTRFLGIRRPAGYTPV